MACFHRCVRVLRTTINPLLTFGLIVWQLVGLLHGHGVF